jgi:hypothetical protein
VYPYLGTLPNRDREGVGACLVFTDPYQRALRSRKCSGSIEGHSERPNAKLEAHGGCSSVGSSARLWFWMSWVQIPPAAPAYVPPLTANLDFRGARWCNAAWLSRSIAAIAVIAKPVIPNNFTAANMMNARRAGSVANAQLRPLGRLQAEHRKIGAGRRQGLPRRSGESRKLD